MPVHSHLFAETYDGLVGFGLDRPTNEKTVIYYLQKFSDDALMKKLIPRLGDDELEALFFSISELLKSHLSEDEYHRLFLKDGTHGDEPH
ncbi:MAG: cytoplasmic protein [Deltaproteobacteria bacterium]|nr:MAG: cytoplasmic protein [Deltaproteobacteria bacterium]RTZ99675.1 MAG: cytoplasmic protein [Deltaproteobacteria bacterium]